MAHSELPIAPNEVSESASLHIEESNPNKDEDGIMSVDWHLAGDSSGLEDLYDYEPGGHHPVHLRDCLGPHNRYRVVHKLGSGGFATVWLCRDVESPTSRYVALKILMAEFSTDACPELSIQSIRDTLQERELDLKHICLPVEHFRVNGNNGSHLCIVYPVLGPSVKKFSALFPDSDKAFRRIGLQIVQALASLHACGICHGDLTPSNILLRIKGLDGLTEEEVLHVLGEPSRNPVTTVSGSTPDKPNLPRYLVRPVNFTAIEARFITNDACITDFGESFEASCPPKELGIPQVYRSPELVLDNTAGYASDSWALGCTLFEMCTGIELFNIYDYTVDDHLFRMVLILGKLPLPWWNTWTSRKKCFEDDNDEQGRVIQVDPAETRANMDGGPIFDIPQSVRQLLAFGYRDWEHPPEKLIRGFADHEVDLLADLLGKLLNYNPQERLTAQDAQSHPWFSM